MNPVFSYFFLVGFGLALGVATVVMPALAYYPRFYERVQRGLLKRGGKR